MGMCRELSSLQSRVSPSWRTSRSTGGSRPARRCFSWAGDNSVLMAESPPGATISCRGGLLGEQDGSLGRDLDPALVAPLEAATQGGGRDHRDPDGSAGNGHVIELARALEDLRGHRARDAAGRPLGLLDAKRL